MTAATEKNWKFIDGQGTFKLENPLEGSYLYLPLVNQAGMLSCVTPTFNGDAKADQNSFLLLPTSVEDLHNSRSARNFWVLVDGTPWSATGASAAQTVQRFSGKSESTELEAGLLWQKVTRVHKPSGLKAEVTSFVPMTTDRVELMRVILTNTGKNELRLTPTAAIPIYGRSADNLRDHRHVTSLLHRTTCVKNGVVVKPTLSFDERGHTHNHLRYAVLGAVGDGSAPIGYFPLVEDFIGEGGSLDWPQAVVQNLPAMQKAGKVLDGFESIGALRFADLILQPGDSTNYIVVLAILDEEQDVSAISKKYASAVKFENLLKENQAFWQQKTGLLEFKTDDINFDGWLKWVGAQPILRRWMGNSFLPYHDYGRGGRGWRDLWQDALALLLTEPDDVSEMLYNNFAGVRMDGSNATIIGNQPGEFKADRNNIPRVWMDHGAWPLLTVAQYIDQSGDLDFLLREQVYFKDRLSHRSKKVDGLWQTGDDTRLKGKDGNLAQGSLLEHMLVQHLTVFFNVGDHNIMRLEGADWNDALDMAEQRGESVAFTALYASNLRKLSDLCLALENKGITQVEIASELVELLQVPVSEFLSVEAKNRRLQAYFDKVAHTVSGKKLVYKLSDLAANLSEKAEWLTNHLRQQEWVTDKKGNGWFNGYYDNQGQPVDGEHPLGVRMTLTGQVFTLMGGIASDEQTAKMVKAADKYLYDKMVDGYRLNTYFGEGTQDLGRAFGFGFGHKENGAMFSHMAVMYGNALYRRGLAKEGWKVLSGIYQQSSSFERSHMFPGLPEYFNSRGRGMYPFLTGSASWYLLTMLTEVYGIKGRLGDLVMSPRVPAELGKRIGVTIQFAGKTLEIEYLNPQELSGTKCTISKVEVNGKPHEFTSAEVVFKREEFIALKDKSKITVTLGK